MFLVVSVWALGRFAARLQLGESLVGREEILLAAAAASCRKATERTRMVQQIRRLQAESLRAEEERRRIGRYLHDEAGQALALLRFTARTDRTRRA